MLLVKSNLIDRTSEDEVKQFNELRQKYMDTVYPEAKEQKEKTNESMTQEFLMKFRGPDGKPRELSFNIQDELDENIVVKDYLSEIKK